MAAGELFTRTGRDIARWSYDIVRCNMSDARPSGAAGRRLRSDRYAERSGIGATGGGDPRPSLRHRPLQSRSVDARPLWHLHQARRAVPDGSHHGARRRAAGEAQARDVQGGGPQRSAGDAGALLRPRPLRAGPAPRASATARLGSRDLAAGLALLPPLADHRLGAAALAPHADDGAAVRHRVAVRILDPGPARRP